MPLCTEPMKHGRCMFEAMAGSTKCKAHDRCVICGQQHPDRRIGKCGRCYQTVCAGMATTTGVYRDGPAHKRHGQFCGPVVFGATA